MCYNIIYEDLIKPILESFDYVFIFLKQDNNDVKYTINIINSNVKILEKELDSIKVKYKKFRYMLKFQNYLLFINKKGNKKVKRIEIV